MISKLLSLALALLTGQDHEYSGHMVWKGIMYAQKEEFLFPLGQSWPLVLLSVYMPTPETFVKSQIWHHSSWNQLATPGQVVYTGFLPSLKDW